MPTVEGLQLGYALHELPPGRWPFRRWRFELWHGERMVAAGWRMTERDAVRALRKHGSALGHSLFGLRPPADEAKAPVPYLPPGAVVRVQAGAVAFSLVPRNLEAPDNAALSLR